MMTKLHRARSSIRLLCWAGYEDAAMRGGFSLAAGVDVHAEMLLSDYRAEADVLARRGQWDVLNINTPFVRDSLHPRGLITPVCDPIVEASLDALPNEARRWLRCARAEDGQLLGVPQRFGPFNIVINRYAMDAGTAADIGFHLPEDAALHNRYGILRYDEFNVMHLAIGAGLDPFSPLTPEGLRRFAALAATWFERAKLVTTDYRLLNHALVRGDIAFYLSGGVYTASSARLEGHRNICAVTPRRGPLDGKGGVAFVEVNAMLAPARQKAASLQYLAHLCRPEVAVRASAAAGASNPVVQMFDATMCRGLSTSALDAMQYEELDQQLDRCADYELIPDYPALLAIVKNAERVCGPSSR